MKKQGLECILMLKRGKMEVISPKRSYLEAINCTIVCTIIKEFEMALKAFLLKEANGEYFQKVLKVSKSQKHFFLKLHCPKNI